MFEGFAHRTLHTPRGEVCARVGGEGPPLLLLHGYPQTHLMWRDVAPLSRIGSPSSRRICRATASPSSPQALVLAPDGNVWFTVGRPRRDRSNHADGYDHGLPHPDLEACPLASPSGRTTGSGFPSATATRSVRSPPRRARRRPRAAGGPAGRGGRGGVAAGRSSVADHDAARSLTDPSVRERPYLRGSWPLRFPHRPPLGSRLWSGTLGARRP